MAAAFTNSTPLIKEPAGYTILPFLPILSPSACLHRQLARLAMRLLAYLFTILTYFIAHAGLYRQLLRRPMALLVSPLPGRRVYLFYTVNQRTYRLYHFAIFAYFSGLCMVTTLISPSANGPTSLVFGHF